MLKFVIRQLEVPDWDPLRWEVAVYRNGVEVYNDIDTKENLVGLFEHFVQKENQNEIGD